MAIDASDVVFLKPTLLVVLLLVGVSSQGNGWNLPNSFYQRGGGSFGSSAGQFGGSGGVVGGQAGTAGAGAWNAGVGGPRPYNAFSGAGGGFANQGALAGVSPGPWNAGAAGGNAGVGGGVPNLSQGGAGPWNAGAGPSNLFPSSGQAGAGVGPWNAGAAGVGAGLPNQGLGGAGFSGNDGVFQASGGPSVGDQQWVDGDGKSLDVAGDPSEGDVDVGSGGDVGTGDGTDGEAGFQQGDGFNPATAFAGGRPGGTSFGPGLGAGTGHHSCGHGPLYGARPFAGSHPGGPHSSVPWRYGSPVVLNGYGGTQWPWHGHSGYVYRVPVAHTNPDGSYSFSYHTPTLAREETGDGKGNVAGTYGFQNDGAKHNFSFSAGPAPEVDLRTNVGADGTNAPPGSLRPEDYGPQSVHSRARLPLVPNASPDGGRNVGLSAMGGNAQTPSGVNTWGNNRNDVNGAGSQGVWNPQGAVNEASLAVVGLPPKGPAERADSSRPTARNQVVRGSTEPSLASNVGDGQSSTASGNALVDPLVTPRPLERPVEQVVKRPDNDPSYNFAYQTPDASRQEAADREGTVRGAFAYNNEAGRNDLQYVAGAGTGFRPIGGSLSVPNGLPNGASATGSAGARDGTYRFGYQTQDAARGTGFRSTGGSLSVPNGLFRGANNGGVGSTGNGAFGGANGGFNVNDGRSFQGGSGFPSGAGTGSSVGFSGGQVPSRQPVTRSPVVEDATIGQRHPSLSVQQQANGALGTATNAGRWNDGGLTTTDGSVQSGFAGDEETDQSTNVNFDEAQQTTTFRGYGANGFGENAGAFTNGKRVSG
ncbi:uncharacterized PE-PGRS family protein PE_PGRS54 [Anopheles nili]|uniref:uncharacterized PE-PGRS family protein PE_PGRS54 n=1 Tax=Anopheles nili TaxID=185578 RepID=UPI00237BE037|nr:uncharacterized PE-PGRS family protein PE_PGRS54 [Anopheles nili]